MRSQSIASNSDFSPQVKGIIGELIAREYLRKEGYQVWLLRVEPPGNLMRNFHYFVTYGGSGEEHYHIDRVLKPEEKRFLLRTRIFDLLAIPKSQLTSDKERRTRLLIDVKARFGSSVHGWSPKSLHKSRYAADLETAKAFGFQIKTLHIDLNLKYDVLFSDFSVLAGSQREP